MASKFWDNVRDRLNAFGKTQKWLANESKVGKTVINSGISRLSSPSVDNAYFISRVLNVSIEELVDGEAGEQYLREYIQEKGWQFSPPDRIADIVAALQKLSDDELVPIRGAITATLDRKEVSGIPPEIKSGKKTG
jgi:transcriptional regulator with XRE-family HTH domain